MATRYVFWRNERGAAHTQSNDKYAPKAVLAAIGQAASLNAEGHASWTNFPIWKYEPVLRAALVVVGPDNEELNQIDAWEIIQPAIAKVIEIHGAGRAMNPNDVLSAANILAASHFRQPSADYYLATSLSVKRLPGKRFKVGKSTIEHIDRLGRFKYPTVLESYPSEHELLKESLRAGYQRVAIRISGRTNHEALRNALRTLGLLRGLWTLFSVGWKISWGEPQKRPIGAVRLGPVHTLHHLDGNLVDDTFWYEDDAILDRFAFLPASGWSKIEKYRKWALRRIQKSVLRPVLEDLINRYASALDHADYNVTFMHLWGILERVTNTIGNHYDDTVSRAAWIFQDHEIAKEVLSTLRNCRNQYVHSSRAGEHQDQVAYSIKLFVDRHLISLIRNEWQVTSLEEYAARLALPESIPSLEAHGRRVKQAIRYRKRLQAKA